ncbi:MAG: DUF2953 domain-containing protein [Candidatus Bipolaricaulota bacterium]|nr:DUF2953 domain-containing protein [Candidatus Bipolaricaulota bacterium]MBS3793175.1 DUF2953 domain-containing protein [Candidatus Bipolaricaulota bacterium]
MIWLIILGPLLLIGLMMGAGKIKVGLALENLEGIITFQYLFFRKRFPLKKSGGEPQKERKRDQKEERAASSKGQDFSLDFLESIPDFFPAVRKFLELFTRYGRVSRLDFTGELGAGDPYYTGLIYGLGQSLGQSVKSLIPQFEFSLLPNFEEETYRFNARGRGEIRFFNLLLILFVTLIYLPKKQVWQLVRSS